MIYFDFLGLHVERNIALNDFAFYGDNGDESLEGHVIHMAKWPTALCGWHGGRLCRSICNIMI